MPPGAYADANCGPAILEFCLRLIVYLIVEHGRLGRGRALGRHVHDSIFQCLGKDLPWTIEVLIDN